MAAPDAHFDKLDVGIDFFLSFSLFGSVFANLFFLTSRAITLDISGEGVGTISQQFGH